MPELSIIVPVYKVEKYLPKCIDSILAQTFMDFELILIDDGSPDRCGQICDEYAAKDPRIKVIHQKNQGVSAARNAGLEIATGTYIGFVDSDDWIEPEMYETLYRIAITQNADIVACGVKHCNEKDAFLFSELLDNLVLYDEFLLAELFHLPNRFGGCIWNKIYRRQAILSASFYKGVKMAEDRLFLFDCKTTCNKGVKTSQELYWVRDHEESATHSKSVRDIVELLNSSYRMMEKAKNSSHYVLCCAIDKYLDDCLVHIPTIRSAKDSHKRSWLYILKGKITMIKVIILAFTHHALPSAKIRGYLYSGIQL